ncbi:prepilin-type N-terminal cleavage/methylation domain protein, partial [Vibrio parahaemolyticus 861]
RCNV